MFIFIETKLFTRLADEHLSDDDLSRLQGYLNRTPKRETSFAGQAVCGNCAGQRLDAGSVWATDHLLPAIQTR